VGATTKYMDGGINYMNRQQLSASIHTTIAELMVAIADKAGETMDELTGQDLADNETWSALLFAYRKLKASKPEERSEKARHYAVAVTEMEKAMAYFYMMVLQDFEG
jgi:hypothetical protein